MFNVMFLSYYDSSIRLDFYMFLLSGLKLTTVNLWQRAMLSSVLCRNVVHYSSAGRF